MKTMLRATNTRRQSNEYNVTRYEYNTPSNEKNVTRYEYRTPRYKYNAPRYVYNARRVNFFCYTFSIISVIETSNALSETIIIIKAGINT